MWHRNRVAYRFSDGGVESMPLIDLIDSVFGLVSLGAEVLPERDKPKNLVLRLVLYCLAAAFFIAAICVVIYYFDWS